MTTTPPIAHIRPMTAADLAEVTCIESAVQVFPWSVQTLADCLTVGYLCYVLEVDNSVKGYAFISIQVGECHILNIAITPAAQGQGYGRQLMQFILDTAHAAQVNTVFLEVRISNIKAINLYRDLGFNEIGIRHDYYQTIGGREDAVMLALELIY